MYRIQLNHLKFINNGHRCIEEFFKQGDMEKRLNLPVSFNCDRDTVSLPQSQLGFIDAIVSPLFSIVCEFFPGMSFTLENMKKNREIYKKEVEDKDKKKNEIKEDKEKEDKEKEDKEKEDKEKEDREKEDSDKDDKSNSNSNSDKEN